MPITVDPSILDTIDLPSNEAHDVVVSDDGQWAFTISTSGRVFSIDVSDPATMASTPTHTLFESTSYSLAQGLFLDWPNRRLYVASKGADCLAIIDVTNPAAMVRIGRVIDATDLNGAADVVVRGNYAYVTCQDGNRLTTVNISNPAAPAIAHVLTHANLTSPVGVVVNLADTHLIVCAGNGLLGVSLSNPAAPAVADFTVAPTSGSTWYVALEGDYAYTVMTGPSDRMDAWNVSNPANILHSSTLVDANLDRPLGITIRSGLAVIPCQTDDGVVGFADVATTPGTPLYVGKIVQTVPGSGTGELYHAYAAAFRFPEDPHDGYLFVGCGAGAFTSLDLGLPDPLVIPRFVKLNGQLVDLAGGA